MKYSEIGVWAFGSDKEVERIFNLGFKTRINPSKLEIKIMRSVKFRIRSARYEGFSERYLKPITIILFSQRSLEDPSNIARYHRIREICMNNNSILLPFLVVPNDSPVQKILDLLSKLESNLIPLEEDYLHSILWLLSVGGSVGVEKLPIRIDSQKKNSILLGFGRTIVAGRNNIWIPVIDENDDESILVSSFPLYGKSEQKFYDTLDSLDVSNQDKILIVGLNRTNTDENKDNESFTLYQKQVLEPLSTEYPIESILLEEPEIDETMKDYFSGHRYEFEMGILTVAELCETDQEEFLLDKLLEEAFERERVFTTKSIEEKADNLFEADPFDMIPTSTSDTFTQQTIASIERIESTPVETREQIKREEVTKSQRRRKDRETLVLYLDRIKTERKSEDTLELQITSAFAELDIIAHLCKEDLLMLESMEKDEVKPVSALIGHTRRKVWREANRIQENLERLSEESKKKITRSLERITNYDFWEAIEKLAAIKKTYDALKKIASELDYIQNDIFTTFLEDEECSNDLFREVANLLVILPTFLKATGDFIESIPAIDIEECKNVPAEFLELYQELLEDIAVFLADVVDAIVNQVYKDIGQYTEDVDTIFKGLELADREKIAEEWELIRDGDSKRVHKIKQVFREIQFGLEKARYSLPSQITKKLSMIRSFFSKTVQQLKNKGYVKSLSTVYHRRIEPIVEYIQDKKMAILEKIGEEWIERIWSVFRTVSFITGSVFAMASVLHIGNLMNIGMTPPEILTPIILLLSGPASVRKRKSSEINSILMTSPLFYNPYIGEIRIPDMLQDMEEQFEDEIRENKSIVRKRRFSKMIYAFSRYPEIDHIDFGREIDDWDLALNFTDEKIDDNTESLDIIDDIKYGLSLFQAHEEIFFYTDTRTWKNKLILRAVSSHGLWYVFYPCQNPSDKNEIMNAVQCWLDFKADNLFLMSDKAPDDMFYRSFDEDFQVEENDDILGPYSEQERMLVRIRHKTRKFCHLARKGDEFSSEARKNLKLDLRVHPGFRLLKTDEQ